MIRAKITGVGKYIPARILTNNDLEEIVETSDDWITSRTGIKERRIAAPEETTSVMGAEAAREAMREAGLVPDNIDMVIFASMTPDHVFPASACLAQDKLGISNAGTVDVEAACSGFVYALSLANAYVVSGMYQNVLVIGSETMSRILDWSDRNTCVLFGDGAGAAVVSRNDTDDSGFMGFRLWGDGKYKDMLYVPAGGSAKPASKETVHNREHYLKMQGNATFKVAVKTMADELLDLLKTYKIEKEQLTLIIPHQANIRILSSVAERLDFPMERVFVNLNKYGNTSAATIPIALKEALEEGRIKKGDYIAFVAFGGGFTAGSVLMKW